MAVILRSDEIVACEQLARRLSDRESAAPSHERQSASIGENKAVMAGDIPLARMLRNAVDKISDADDAAHRRVRSKLNTKAASDLVLRDRVWSAGSMNKKRTAIFRRPSAIFYVFEIGCASLEVSRSGDDQRSPAWPLLPISTARPVTSSYAKSNLNGSDASPLREDTVS